MLDFSHIPGTDVTWLTGASTTAVGTGMTWQAWQKPRGKTMVSILLLGKGGNGGNGVVGANSTAAGGGGGGSGTMATLVMPLALLPDTIFFSLAGQQATTTVASYVAIYPSIIATPPPNHTIMIANGGGNGGNASGATAGAVGAAGSLTGMTAATMPIGWQWSKVLAGQAGIIGATTGSGNALTLPVTGLIVTGGTGGGGLPAAAASGTAGGGYTVPAQPSPFPAHTAPAVTAVATTPPGNGAGGYKLPGLLYFYGGLGGGSTHGTATTTGLVGAYGGNGAFGCGGGGGGGALTGSTQGIGGFGGPALAIITCW